jgi:hypothetical protein
MVLVDYGQNYTTIAPKKVPSKLLAEETLPERD